MTTTNQQDLLADLLISYGDQQLAHLLSQHCDTTSRQLYAQARERQATSQAESMELGRACNEWGKRANFWKLAAQVKVR